MTDLPPKPGLAPLDYERLRTELIARAGTLSRRLAQVAQFFLNHPEEVAIRTLVRLADHLIDTIGAMRAEQAFVIGPRDVLLVKTFDDYRTETVEVARLAARAGRMVLAITDNELSPMAGLSTHVLYVNEARLGHFRSQVPAMVVCQTIIVSLGRRFGTSRKANIQNR